MLPLIFSLFSACLWVWANAAATTTTTGSYPPEEGWDNANWPTLIPLEHFGEKSYYFSIYAPVSYTYLEADQFCKAIEMELVRVQSREENDFLLNYIQKSTKVDQFWTAGSKLLNTKRWIWMTTGETVQYTNWGTGQPANPKTEHCIALRVNPNKGLVFTSRTCNAQLSFVCEKDKRRHIVRNEETSNCNSTFPIQSVSPNVDLLRFESKSYYFSTSKGTYFEAFQFCEMIDMRLVSIFKEAENSRLYKHIRDTNLGQQFWSSGTARIDDKTWVWLSAGMKVNYTNWAPGKIDLKDGRCIVLQNKNNGLLWKNWNCKDEYKFICERPDCEPVHGGPGSGSGSTGQSQSAVKIYINNNQCSGCKDVSTINGEGCVVVNNNIQPCSGNHTTWKP